MLEVLAHMEALLSPWFWLLFAAAVALQVADASTTRQYLRYAGRPLPAGGNLMTGEANPVMAWLMRRLTPSTALWVAKLALVLVLALAHSAVALAVTILVFAGVVAWNLRNIALAKAWLGL